jgi:hypothetical protein
MPAKDHAAWDLVSVLARTPSRIKPAAADEYRPLALARTAFLNPGSDPILVRETYEQRTKSTEPMKPHFAEKIGIALLGVSFLALGIWLYLGGKPFQTPTLWVGCLFAVGMYTSGRPLRFMRRTTNRFLNRHCPDCSYDLSASHADPPLNPESLGINLGPRHCPECGALWPLVPPEAPPQR